MGFYETDLASLLVTYLTNYTLDDDLGIVFGADEMVRLDPELVRIPETNFVSWQRLPDRVIPREPIPDWVPDLAVEIISKSNTAEEMTPN